MIPVPTRVSMSAASSLTPAISPCWSISRRPDVMAHLAQWNAGTALGEDTRRRVVASSAVAVILVPGGALTDYARGGSAAEAVWITAHQRGLAVQPISPVFLYARDVQDLTEWSTAFADELGDLQKEFQQLVQIPATASPALVLLLPDSFIGIAESMDLAGELGRWVLRNACAEFSRWRSRGVGQIAVLHSMCRLCNWRPGFGAEPSQSRSCQVCLAPTPG